MFGFKKDSVTVHMILIEKLLGNQLYVRFQVFSNECKHGLRTPREEIAFTARPKIHSHSQIFRYGGSIFCLPHRPEFSGFFAFCLHWVSVVRAPTFKIISTLILILIPLLFQDSKFNIFVISGC